MNNADLALIQTWVEGNKKALEWQVGNRTFQILGLGGAMGLYERFFNKGDHPTRRKIGEAEMIEALQNATSPLELYRGEKGSGEFFESAEAALVAAKALLETK